MHEIFADSKAFLGLIAICFYFLLLFLLCLAALGPRSIICLIDGSSLELNFRSLPKVYKLTMLVFSIPTRVRKPSKKYFGL